MTVTTISLQQAELEAAADKPGTAQYHRKVTAALQRQIDERRGKQQELETIYREKKEEYTTTRQEYDEVSVYIS